MYMHKHSECSYSDPLTQKAPEGSAMKSSEPSGPNEENIMLAPNGLRPPYTVYWWRNPDTRFTSV